MSASFRPRPKFTPKQVETKSEREKLMFRVKIRVPEETVESHIDIVKTGDARSVGYVKVSNSAAWPASLREPASLGEAVEPRKNGPARP